MRQIWILLLVAVMTSGCGKYGQKLLGIEKDDVQPAPAPLPTYVVGGDIRGDFMVYGDQEFRKAVSVSVKVCTKEETDCQLLPRRTQATMDNKEASFMWVRDGVWITYVPRNLLGMRRFTITASGPY